MKEQPPVVFLSAVQFREAINDCLPLNKLLANLAYHEQSSRYRSAWFLEGEIPDVGNLLQTRKKLRTVGTDVYLSRPKGATTASCSITIHAVGFYVLEPVLEEYERRMRMAEYNQMVKNLNGKPHKSLGQLVQPMIPRTLTERLSYRTLVRGMHNPFAQKVDEVRYGRQQPPTSQVTSGVTHLFKPPAPQPEPQD